MFKDTLITLFSRDLRRVITELELYLDESKIWQVEKGIANSAANLCLHLIGNLNTYIGAEIGKTNYTRNRELEFSAKNISRASLIRQIEETIIVIRTSLDKLTPEEMEMEYPILVFQTKTSVEHLLVHLSAHLAYHLGQINYHRRLIDLK